jgi:hypothetical protein
MATKKKGSALAHLLPLFLVVWTMVIMCCCCCSGTTDYGNYSDYEDMFGECTDVDTPFGTICVPDN